MNDNPQVSQARLKYVGRMVVRVLKDISSNQVLEIRRCDECEPMTIRKTDQQVDW